MAEEKSSKSGVPAKGKGTEAPEALTREQVDELLRGREASIRKEFEGHVDRVRSDLMRASGEKERQLQAQIREYEDKLNEAQLDGLDEPKKAEARLGMLSGRLDEMYSRLAELEAENQTLKQIGPYVKGLKSAFGVDIDNIDLTDPQAAMETGWVAAAQKSKEREQRIAELEGLVAAGKEKPTKEETTAPEVVTTEAGSTPSGSPSLLDIRKSVTQRLGRKDLISEDELFTLAERPEMSGVDLNQVLPALEEEIKNLQ